MLVKGPVNREKCDRSNLVIQFPYYLRPPDLLPDDELLPLLLVALDELPVFLAGLELTPLDLVPVLLGVLLTAGVVFLDGVRTLGVDRCGCVCCLGGGE